MGLVAALQRLFTSKSGSDLSTSESFDALRAFGVEGDDGQSPSYFIELADRRVLFVSGKSLNGTLPCTSLLVSRNGRRGRGIELTCRGDVLEPEVMTLPFTRGERKQRKVPEDGAIVSGRSYDAIKSERLAAAFLSYE